jgi:hypothetical protein
LDLHYVAEVYARSRSVDERNRLLAIAPPFSIFKNDIHKYMLEHDLHPLNPVPDRQHLRPMAACTFVASDLEACIAVESVVESINLHLRRFSMMLHSFWQRKLSSFRLPFHHPHEDLRIELITIMKSVGYTEEQSTSEWFGVTHQNKFKLVLDIL